jgi:hypothetical protein
MDKIFLAYRNADTTEGRGPMVIDKAFRHRNDALSYIDDKPGVMGRTAKWSQEKYGDWKVEEIVVYSNLTEANNFDFDQAKAKALSKLTEDEKRILGLK